MGYELTKDIIDYLDGEVEATKSLLKTMTLIPAPSHHEDEKAEFVKKWLEDAGACGVYIDEAKNVIYEIKGENENEAVVFMAHTDTVFPFDTPLIWREDDEKFYCPGVGDDTCSLAILMAVAKYIIKNGLKPKKTVLFVANSCEEGLGNLKGSKQIVKSFAGLLNEFYTFDGKFQAINCKCVGSHRYKVKCTSEGGHSFGAFGNTNAIAELSRLVADLYTVEVPKKEGTKTTYNVGMISGGTSVNTIAQFADMLYEYRSDDRECLAAMKATFEEKVAAIQATSKANFEVELVGDRPCDGIVDEVKHREIIDRAKAVCKKYSGFDCLEKSGSTDCNSASAAGIPSVCVGVYNGGGAHTREEWVKKESIAVGLKIAAELILHYFN